MAFKSWLTIVLVGLDLYIWFIAISYSIYLNTFFGVVSWRKTSCCHCMFANMSRYCYCLSLNLFFFVLLEVPSDYNNGTNFADHEPCPRKMSLEMIQLTLVVSLLQLFKFLTSRVSNNGHCYSAFSCSKHFLIIHRSMNFWNYSVLRFWVSPGLLWKQTRQKFNSVGATHT